MFTQEPIQDLIQKEIAALKALISDHNKKVEAGEALATCRKCKKEFHTSEELAQHSYPTSRAGALFSASLGVVSENRSCMCGATIRVQFGDRRGQGKHNNEMRDIFEQCIDVVTKKTHYEEDNAREVVRGVFRSYLSLVSGFDKVS